MSVCGGSGINEIFIQFNKIYIQFIQWQKNKIDSV